MAYYQNSEDLTNNLKQLFTQINESYPDVIQDLNKSRLIIRLRTSNPISEFTVNGRTNPVKVDFGPSRLRPDLDVEMPADSLHNILLDELSLKDAFTNKQMKIRGPFMKSFVLEGIFRCGQEIYPQILAHS